MRGFFVSCALAATIGCAVPAAPVVTPAEPGKPRGAVSAAALGEALARRIEAGDPMTTQHVWKLAQRATQDAGLEIDLGEPPSNAPLDAAGRQTWATRFRGWR